MSITFYSLSIKLHNRKSRNGRNYVHCNIEVERGTGDSLATAFIARQKWKTLGFRASLPSSSIRKALSCVQIESEGMSDEVIRVVRKGQRVLRYEDPMLHCPNLVWGSFSWHHTGSSDSGDTVPTIVRHPWGTEERAFLWELVPFCFIADGESLL